MKKILQKEQLLLLCLFLLVLVSVWRTGELLMVSGRVHSQAVPKEGICVVLDAGHGAFCPEPEGGAEK